MLALFIIVVAMGLFVAFIAPIFTDFINVFCERDEDDKEEEEES